MEPTAHYQGMKTIQIVQSQDYQSLKIMQIVQSHDYKQRFENYAKSSFRRGTSNRCLTSLDDLVTVVKIRGEKKSSKCEPKNLALRQGAMIAAILNLGSRGNAKFKFY